ncbi:MAG: lipid-A-disaccharide synthase [Robiginitomaculum sp.]|nr:MAG: lipid-A-disaccharide synthase [Robiginitomaculum sp.]
MQTQNAPENPIRIFLVAGEASGDVLAAELIEPLRAQFGDNAVFAGVGGPALAARGVPSSIDMSQLSVLGFFEGLMAWRRVSRLAKETAKQAAAFKADIVVLVDSWGFTMRVAHAVRALRPEALLVKYVGPQVWATRPGRVKNLAAAVDHLLSIHAFEAPYYVQTDLPVTFVGNPVLSRKARGDRAALRQRYNIADDTKVLLVLFGSRRAEFTRLHDAFVQAVEDVRARHPDLMVFCPLSGAIAIQVQAAASEDRRLQDMIFLDEADNADAFATADLALACSGTVTTELAAAGVPMVVGYKIGGLTWFLLKTFFLKTRYASLVNIAVDEMIVPEFIQEACTETALSAALDALLSDPDTYAQQKYGLGRAIANLQSGGPSTAHRAAEVIHHAFKKRA